MRPRVGIGLMLAIAVGGVLVFTLRDRGEPPPAEPPGVAVPEVLPELEPARIPSPPPPGEDLPGPLKPYPREIVLPPHPVKIEVPDLKAIELRTGPPKQDGPPAPPPDPAPEEAPAPQVPIPPPPEPEKPPEEESRLVKGKEALPLPGPVEDPADLPTPEEIQEAEPPVPGAPRPVRDGILAAVNDALRVMTRDGEIQLKVFGRLYFDAVLMNAEQELENLVGDFNDGGEFRAARLGLLGVVDFAEFKIDYDFAGGDTLVGEPDLKNLWIGARDVPLLGRVRFGRMKEPLGLEQLMSGNARTFMEPSLPKALTIGRNPGLLAFDTELSGRLCWWAGMFGHTPDNNPFGKFGTNVSVRVCGTPWFEEKGKRLLHLGVSGSLRGSRSGETSIAQRPESHLAPNIVETRSYSADRESFLGLEAAVKDGPYSLQGEVQRTSVQTEAGGRSTFWGAYLYGSVILTGEHRIYRRGTFWRPRVRKVAFDDGLGGAWELAVRLSHLDLSSGDLDGGVVTDGTVGLTWYMDNHSRFMINYIHTHRRGVGGANILQCRLQLDF